jgi:AhpD family alkylhydroperoxidase
MPANHRQSDQIERAHLPPESLPLLAAMERAFGFTPNLGVSMAHSPAALEGYLQGLTAYDKSSALTAIERQIVMATASQANGAAYGVAVHATLAARLGASADDVGRLRKGEDVLDERMSSVQAFVRSLIANRGAASAEARQSLVRAGYSKAAVVEIAFGVALKAFANAVAHASRPEIDRGFL